MSSSGDNDSRGDSTKNKELGFVVAEQPNNRKAILTGTIVGRRSLGQFLAFCDIQILRHDDSEDDSDQTRIVSVAFRRNVMLQHHCDDAADEGCDDFPVKKTALPYGARVEVTCICSSDPQSSMISSSCSSDDENDDKKTNDILNHESSEIRNSDTTAAAKKKTAALWNVLRWKLLSHPHDKAVQVATLQHSTYNNNDKPILLCTDYFRSRREAYDAVMPAKNVTRTTRRKQQATKRQQPQRQIHSSSSNNSSHEDGTNYNNKSIRSKVFAKFLWEHVLSNNDTMKQQRVLDVAGGKGLLSLELAQTYGMTCTVVDPVVRKRKTVRIKNRNNNNNNNDTTPPPPPPEFVAAYFEHDNNNTSDNTNTNNTLVESHTCLVGMHPDQCTEAILDAALRYQKSVAIVPCCVFADLFPTRLSQNKRKNVRTYDEFIEYLLEKDDRLQKAVLPFDGKNVCIYLKQTDDLC